MIRITNTISKETSTSVDGIVSAIMQDGRGGGVGAVEQLHTDVDTITDILQAILDVLPEKDQVEIVNKTSWRFGASVVDDGE